MENTLTLQDPKQAGREVDAMSAGQRAALHDLLHPGTRQRSSRWTRRDRGLDLAWGGILAGLLVLVVTSFGVTPAWLDAADGLYAATHAPAVATAQSSVASRRTM